MCPSIRDGIKENYEVFSTKCSQCHKLSRPINSDYAVPENGPLHQADDAQARLRHQRRRRQEDLDFLAYDSSVRKEKMLDEKLAKATPEEKKAAEDKIKNCTTSTINSRGLCGV